MNFAQYKIKTILPVSSCRFKYFFNIAFYINKMYNSYKNNINSKKRKGFDVIMVEEYPHHILKRLQNTMLEIYKDLYVVCKKYDISFFAYCGTLLGAVRHNGFIPWDDDMDLAMLREDYDRFIEYCVPELSDRYDWFTMANTPGYVLEFGKLCKKGTEFVEATDRDRIYTSGIFVDIFPLDRTFENPKQRDRIMVRARRWVQLGVLSQYKHSKLPQGLSGTKIRILNAACSAVHAVLNIAKNPQEKCRQNYLKTIKNIKDDAGTCYADFAQANFRHFYLMKDEIFPLHELKFEDTVIPVPAGYGKILQRNFGDYMKLPSVEERHTHAAYYIDFGDETYKASV